MQQLDFVTQGYLSASTDVVGGVPQRKRVPGQPQSDAELQIKLALPDFFHTEIKKSGRDPAQYRVYGSTGQVNFNFARIPWVAALHRDITKSTERGYYIVLLFREDMKGCVLSLNQGYTQFKTEFVLDEVAAQKIRESAAVAATYLDLPDNFVRGSIKLGATGSLGVGYEEGAIVSAIYSASKPITAEQFAADFRMLLDAYDTLRGRVGKSLADLVSPANEDEFQEAVAVLSKPSNKTPYVPPPPGPVTPPPKLQRATSGGYKRDARVSGAAIHNSTYECEIDASHLSFVARTTKKNFVEAHHLIPMQFQDRFTASLDVLENIVVLCPTCHRKLHHGRIADKKVIVSSLYSKRMGGLKDRGINVSENELIALYKSKLEDE